MFKLTVLIFLFYTSACFAQKFPVYTPSAKGLNPKSYQLNIDATYHTTASIFNNNGEKVELTEGNSFSMTDGNLLLGYGIGKRLDGFLGVKARQVTTQYFNGTENLSPSNSGVESFMGLFKYSFAPQDNLQWALDFSYRQTTYEQKFYATLAEIPENEIVLGDAGQEYSFGIHTSFTRGGGNFINSVIRYVVPANDLSEEIQYKFDFVWGWKRLAVIFGAQGVYSLKQDNFTDDPQNKPFQATGATARFNSINREKVEPFIGINWAFRSWRLEFESGATVSGRSTDNGQYYKMGFMYQTRGVSGEEFKIQAFKEYIVDATILKVSPRGKFIKIDQGISSDVEKGMKFDVFQTDYFGENILVASGAAYEVSADTAILKILKKYKKIDIKKGFAARGY